VFAIERARGTDTDVAQTTAVTMLALGQLAYLFNCRFLGESSLTPRVLRGNRVVWIATGALLVLQLVFTYVPFMNSWFDSAPIGPREWALTLGFAILVFLLMEAMKAITRVQEARSASRSAVLAGPGTVAVEEAGARLPDLVRSVEHGDEVTLTRDGKPVARLVPVRGTPARRTSGRRGPAVAPSATTTAIQLAPPPPDDAPVREVPAAPAGATAVDERAADQSAAGVPADERASDVPGARAASGRPTGSTDATIVLDPVSPDDPAAPSTPGTPGTPSTPTRRARRSATTATEQLGRLDPDGRAPDA
jgi:prevent-host-death family protein